MAGVPTEDGLRVVEPDDEGIDHEALASEDGVGPDHSEPADTDLETLRAEFVDAFNARDLDSLVALVADDIECPDIRNGDGKEAFAEELEAIWERSPGAILTRALLDGSPCAVAWLPDEEGRWLRAALVCFDADDGLLSLIALPDDVDGLERAEADDPTGEELDEWNDWAEWERGEESRPGGGA